MQLKKIVTKIGIAASLVFGSFFTMAQFNDNQNGGRKVGPCYVVADSTGEQKILSVVELQSDNDQFHYQYYLQLNETGNLSSTKRELITQSNKRIDHGQIVGLLSNVIWILTDSLIGYDVRSLKKLVSEQDILLKNQLQDLLFSRRHNSYLLDEAAQVMYITADNGEGYKLYPDLSLKPDDSANDKSPENFSYEFAADYKLYGRYQLKYAVTCIDSSNNKLYILGSSRETAQVFSYVGTSIFAERDEFRQISIIPYKADGESVDFKKDKPETKKNTYYKGAFLLDKFFTTVWKGKNGERLIIYADKKSAKPMFSIALTDTNGNEQWQLITAFQIDEFADYLIDNDYLLTWFTHVQDKLTTTTLISINLSNGQQTTYRYQ